ncbi:MAG: hypothetical protein WCO06_00915 [Candidatus Roizmanbacteria bacterium]
MNIQLNKKNISGQSSVIVTVIVVFATILVTVLFMLQKQRITTIQQTPKAQTQQQVNSQASQPIMGDEDTKQIDIELMKFESDLVDFDTILSASAE